MKSRFYKRSIILIILMLLIPHSNSIATEECHTYLGISFEDATPVLVDDSLFEARGIHFPTDVQSGTAEVVEEFGYPFSIQCDFGQNHIGISRVLLRSLQPARVSPDVFESRLQSDACQFYTMDEAITRLYGKPDTQYFLRSDGTATSPYYQWDTEIWTVDQMLSVCEIGYTLHFVSVWDNVVLHHWIDSVKLNGNGEFLTRILLYYYPDCQSDTISKILTSYEITDGGLL